MKKSNIAMLIVFLLVIPATLFLSTKIPGRSYYITGATIIAVMLIPLFMAVKGRKVRARERVLIVFLLVIPATLFLGPMLPGRSYYITGTAIIAEMMIPFFMAFEGRKVQARELVLIAVMCALAIVSRVAMPIPHFKPIFAVIMLAGIAFGPETGFMVGAISAFASNFFYGQGAFTPWQMFAYGAGGMLTGFFFAKGRLPRKGWIMAIVGAFTAAFLVGPLLDASGIFLIPAKISWPTAKAILLAGSYVNITQAICTALVLLILGGPFLGILDRIKRKYGIMENNRR